MKPVSADEMTREQLLAAIDKSFQRCDRLMTEGGTTPNAPDVEDLNLVRNHIIHYRYYLNNLEEPLQTSLFDALVPASSRPLPPEVPNCFMVPNGKYPNRVSRVYYPVLTHSMELDRSKWKPSDVF